jgi:arabinose-5-phosphate isomerase
VSLRKQDIKPDESAQQKILDSARRVIKTEMAALQALIERVDQNFCDACRCILGCKGRTVVLGMGKSGHIASKIAATLASTGTPAFFVHPGEASHGDLGMITPEDVVVALSNSGETDEINMLLPIIKRLGVPLISLTGNPQSTLARASTITINVGVDEEACPLGLAPTSSTTAALAMGDAIAIALLQERNFSERDFAASHPGGSLGRRLLLRVCDVMHTGAAMPLVRPDTSLKDALLEMSRKGRGTTAVVDADKRVVGIFTDGDLRRALDAGTDLHTVCTGEVMTRGGRTIDPDALAAEAIGMMDKHKINALLVVDEHQRLIGVLNMHDLLRARVM